MATNSKKKEYFTVFIIILILLMFFYSISNIFKNVHKSVGPAEVFALEFTLATTSGFLAPVNSWFRNKDYSFSYEDKYEKDIDRYGAVYRQGLYYHPIALVLGDIFGSIFSILSAIAFFFARRSSLPITAFKIMFFTELLEETLYYINVYRMTGEFDVGPIDIGVTLVIALIVGFFGRQAQKRHQGV
ncbi:MAG: hypothetical protein ABJN40_01650 [Sneathiella sp.]